MAADFLFDSSGHGRLGAGMRLGATSDGASLNLDGPTRGRRDLTDYFNNYNDYPRGTSFDVSVGDNVSTGKRPRMDADFLSVAPFGARSGKKQRMEDEGVGLGGDLSYGLIDALSNTGRGGGGGRASGVNAFGYPRSSDVAYKSTIGFLSNPTIPGNEVVLKKMPFYELPGQHDIVFIRDHMESEHQAFKRSVNSLGSGFIDETPRTAFHLPGMNHFLGRRQKTFQNAREYLNAMERANANGINKNLSFDPVAAADGTWDISSADDILRFFSIGGIIDTENFAENTSSVDYQEHAIDQARVNSNDKKVNIIQYGRADVFNIWGRGEGNSPLDIGTYLWFIYKPVLRPMAYRVDATRHMTSGDVDFMSNTYLDYSTPMEEVVDDIRMPRLVSAVTAMPWQIIPWAKNGSHKGPSSEELAYRTPIGLTGYGAAVPVAYVMKEDYLTTNDNQSLMASDLGAVRNRQLLDVYYFS